MIARRFCPSKICRRKAKIWLFPFGKSEKLCFSAGDQGSPLQVFLKMEFFCFSELKKELSFRGPTASGNLLEGSTTSNAVPEDSHGRFRSRGMTALFFCAVLRDSLIYFTQTYCSPAGVSSFRTSTPKTRSRMPDRQTSAGDPKAASRPFSITATRSA